MNYAARGRAMPMNYALKGGIFALASLIACLLPRAARADHAELAPDDDLAETPRSPATSAKADSISVGGLVPLKELNRQPYAGIWLLDFRLHNFELGLGVQTVSVDGSVRGSFNNGQFIQDVQESVSGKLEYGSFFGGYYLPLVGYTPEFSVGLLPMLRLGVGGAYSGDGSSALTDRQESKVGTLIELPVFAMARVGRHASRYGAWDVSLGAGVGFSFVDLSAGEPIANSAAYLAPALRLEAAYGIFQAGYEMALTNHDKSFGGADHLSYRMTTITLAIALQPEPDD
jgi:hypothetical protein